MLKNILLNLMRIAFFCKDDFNLGVAYVIGFLKSQGHDIKLFLSYRETALRSYNPELICISCVTATVDWGIKIAKRIRTFSRVRIVFGGVHPTLCPETITNEGFEVCNGDGISFFGGRFDPDNHWPDREIFFKELPPVHRRYQIFMTGFGCPFKCSYCNSQNLHQKLIRRSVKGCIDELRYLKETGLKYVLFVDDVFVLNPTWLMQFLEEYSNNVNLPFTCFGHTKTITREIAYNLRKSNCQAIWLGVQSGSENVRNNILNRYETNSEIFNA